MAAVLGPLASASRSARPRHVAAALGPLACPSRSARPRKARGPNLTLNMYTNLLKIKKMVMYKIDRRGGGPGGRGPGGRGWGPKIVYLEITLPWNNIT